MTEISEAPLPIGPDKKRRPLNILILLLLAGALLGATLLLGWRNRQPRTSYSYPGCGYEDHVLCSVAFFKELGFFNSFFLPYDSHNDFYTPPDSWLYTHIPPFSEVFFGAVHALLGVTTVHGLRWFSIVLNIAALAALFQAMALLKNRVFGLLVVLAALAHPNFWMRAHGLYEYAFGLPHQALLLLGLAIYSRTQRKVGLALAFAGAFWQGACTVVYQLQTYLILMGFYALGTARERRAYFLVALAGPLAFAAHVFQLVLLNGTAIDAVRDLFGSYLQKSIAAGPLMKGPSAFRQFDSFGAYLAAAARHVTGRIGGGPRISLLALALTFGALGVAAVQKQATEARAELIKVAFLFVGSALWFFAMPEVAMFDMGPALYSLWLFVALTLAVPIYAFGAAIKGVFWERKYWAAPLAVALGFGVAALVWARYISMANYVAEQRGFLASFGLAADGAEPPLWSVGESDGLRGRDWQVSLNVNAPQTEKYRRVACDENAKPSCRDPIQGLRFFFWQELTPRAANISLTCGAPGDTRVALYQVGEGDLHGVLLGAVEIPNFTGGPIAVPATRQAPGRVFTVEIGPAACDSYVIDSAVVQ